MSLRMRDASSETLPLSGIFTSLGNDDAALGLFPGIGINIIPRRKLNKDKGDNGYQKEGDQGCNDSPC